MVDAPTKWEERNELTYPQNHWAPRVSNFALGVHPGNRPGTWIIISVTSLFTLIEGSLEVKFPTIWTDRKEEVGRVREKKRRRKKMQMREKVEKSQFTVFF